MEVIKDTLPDLNTFQLTSTAEINQSARSDTSRALILTQQKISERRREQMYGA